MRNSWRAQPELMFNPAKFHPRFLVFVCGNGQRIAGFYTLIPLPSKAVELNDLWVDPQYIGLGIGKQLWLHAIETARAHGYQTILLTADPNAEAFYRKRGAITIGSVPSNVGVGRNLPRMEYRL